jgi:hypothetical protein
MRRLAVFAGATVAAIVATGAGAVVARATPTCGTGYSWSNYDRTSLASTLSTNVIAKAASTPSGNGTGGYLAHVAGYISVGSSSGGGNPFVQTGILDGGGGVPRFYIEEEGATNPPSGWVNEIDDYYIYEFGSPALDTAYGFQIIRTDTRKFEAVTPGYTSPVLTFPSTGHQINFSEFTNEVLANSSTCPDSDFEFTSPSPWNFGSYSYFATGTDPDYFDEWLNSLTDWESAFPVSCQPQCEVQTSAGSQTTPSTIFTAPPPVPPTG